MARAGSILGGQRSYIDITELGTGAECRRLSGALSGVRAEIHGLRRPSLRCNCNRQRRVAMVNMFRCSRGNMRGLFRSLIR